MASCKITNRGVEIPSTEFYRALGPHAKEFLASLTIHHQPKIGRKVTARCYLGPRELAAAAPTNVTTPKYVFPRGLLPQLRAVFQIENTLGMGRPINRIEFTGRLFPAQETVVRGLSQYLNGEIGALGMASCLLRLRAGFGKTFIAAYLAAQLGVKTLYIVPRDRLLEQAICDLGQCLSARIGRLGGGVSTDGDIIVGIINSVCRQPEEWFTQFGFVVYDEVHMYLGEQHRKIFFTANARYNLGMSATVAENRFGFDKYYHLALGNYFDADKIPACAEDAKFDVVVHAVHYHGPPEYTQTLCHESTDAPFVHYMYSMLLADEYRCSVIYGEILRLYLWRKGDYKHNIFVFAEEREHLRKLMQGFAALLAQRRQGPPPAGDEPLDLVECAVEGNELGWYVGGVKLAEVEKASRARVIFTTYSLSSTGISWPWMTAMVLTTPRRRNTRQLAARILRRGSPADHPREIVDIIDSRTFLRSQWASRESAYATYSARIIHTNRDSEYVRRGDEVQVAAAFSDE